MARQNVDTTHGRRSVDTASTASTATQRRHSDASSGSDIWLNELE